MGKFAHGARPIAFWGLCDLTGIRRRKRASKTAINRAQSLTHPSARSSSLQQLCLTAGGLGVLGLVSTLTAFVAPALIRFLARPSGRRVVLATAAVAAAARRWRSDLGNVGLFNNGRIVLDRRASPTLQKSDVAQTGLRFGLRRGCLGGPGVAVGPLIALRPVTLLEPLVSLRALILLGPLLMPFGWLVSILAVLAFTLLGIAGTVIIIVVAAVARGTLTVALRLAILALLRVVALAAFVAPALVVALAEAAHGLDHAEIMFGILPIGLRQDPVARGRSLAGQRLILVEHLVGVAAHPYVGATAIEKLVSIGLAIGVVGVLLLVVLPTATTAATVATAAAGPLPIVWSHS
jgi:hypothetical protein